MVYSLGMEPSEVGSESVRGGAFRFRLVSVFFFFFCRCRLRVTQHNVSPSWVTVVDGAFASLVLSVWAGMMVVSAGEEEKRKISVCVCVRACGLVSQWNEFLSHGSGK